MYNQRTFTNNHSKSTSKKTSNNNAVLFSAALQDHIMKKGNFKIDSELLGHKSIQTKFPNINRKAHSNKDIVTKPGKAES